MATTRVSKHGETVTVSRLTDGSYVCFERNPADGWHNVYVEVSDERETVGVTIPAWVLEAASQMKPWDDNVKVDA